MFDSPSSSSDGTTGASGAYPFDNTSSQANFDNLSDINVKQGDYKIIIHNTVVLHHQVIASASSRLKWFSSGSGASSSRNVRSGTTTWRIFGN